MSYQVLPNTPVNVLNSTDAFEQLTHQEKMYAYWMSRASWAGSTICYVQTSPESVSLLALLNSFFRNILLSDSTNYEVEANNIYRELSRLATEVNVSQQDVDGFLLYCATFYDNMGNYYSFGNTKFIPNIPSIVFKQILQLVIVDIDQTTIDAIYATSQNTIGFNDKATCQTTYHSSNMSEVDVNYVNNYLTSIGVEPYNTRVKKVDDVFIIMVGCAETNSTVYDNFTLPDNIRFEYGDHQQYLTDIVSHLTNAMAYVANPTQRLMLESYIRHFTYGNIEDHKQAQIHWVKDISPSVETNIGFIESYDDPSGVRGEWEGFVAVVNKKQSEKFNRLVQGAPTLLELLPWGRSYEKDVFLKPDFTSIEIVAFACSGIPSGINIPNYNDIRQNIGFKNVSLGNVINARLGSKTTEPIRYVRDIDQDLYKNLSIRAYEVQVGLHELIGHGSGKLFYEADKRSGSDNTVSHYLPNQTYNSVFGRLASTYEECRAELVGLLLSVNSNVLDIFEVDESERSDISYVNWLTMVRSGLLGLQTYNPETKTWGQAHSQARFVILNILLEAGNGLVEVVQTDTSLKCGAPATDFKDGGENAQALSTPSYEIHLDRSKILETGIPAVQRFLRLMQEYKSTANITSAQELYSRYDAINDYWLGIWQFLKKNAQPRSLIIQPIITLDGEDVKLHQFDLTNLDNVYMGHIISNVMRGV